MRLLHIIPSLDWGSAERQLPLVFGELPGERFDQRLIVLRGHVPAVSRGTTGSRRSNCPVASIWPAAVNFANACGFCTRHFALLASSKLVG